jgi:hypothetical protein
MNLQGSAAKTAETLQSQTQPGRENRFLFNGIAVVHGRLKSVRLDKRSVPRPPEKFLHLVL